MVEDLRDKQSADPQWFRQPSQREHRMGGWLFLGFALFFALSFVLLKGSMLRWVMLTLGACSFVRCIYHFLRARTAEQR